MHVATPEGECKWWLHPVRLARNDGIPPRLVREIEKSVFQHQKFLVEKFHAFHGTR